MAGGKHLVLDVDVAVDACVVAEASPDVTRLLLAMKQHGATLWVAASSLASTEAGLHRRAAAQGASASQAARTAADQLSQGLAHLRVLTSFGFEQAGLVARSASLADAQLEAAARCLPAGRACIVTREPSQRGIDERPWHTPDSALQWLEEDAVTGPLPFIDLAAQQALLRPKLEQGIEGVLRHGRYILGPEVAQFEARLAAFVGVSHCIAVGNGTDALQIALQALGVGQGEDDEVITPAFNFVAAAECATLLQARPVFVDVVPGTFNLDAEKLEVAITPRTKAIVPSSLYGQCADYRAINAVAARHGVPVIEDAAQSLGASQHGRRSGALTLVGCTSFFPSKPLGGYGDGGAIFTDDDTLALAMRQIATHGQAGRYRHVRVGVNSRLDSLQAAVLLAKLEVLDAELVLRREVAQRYDALLAQSGVTPPIVASGNQSAWAQYTVRVPRRDDVRAAMEKAGIPTIVHYPTPLHRQPAFVQPRVELPESERAADEVLSLPMGPYLSAAQQEQVVRALEGALASS